MSTAQNVKLVLHILCFGAEKSDILSCSEFLYLCLCAIVCVYFGFPCFSETNKTGNLGMSTQQEHG